MSIALGILFLCLPLIVVGGLLAFVYTSVRLYYLHPLERIFVEKPLFVIPRGDLDPAAADVRFPTADGMYLQGVYFRAHTGPRKGVILFGIEYGADRWSCRSYCDPLLDAGYDVFTYEPRNQGKSDVIPGYEPLQWITEYEVADARAAVAYLRSRPDADPKGIGMFGVSKGANAGLALMSEDPGIRCGVTDGAFGLLSVMLPYMRHWIGIYNRRYFVHGLMPAWFYAHMACVGMRRVERDRKLRFYHLEKRAARVRQPVLMIHGEADSYIKMGMARAVYDPLAGPKEFWAVPKARHNQSVSVAGPEFARRVVAFSTNTSADEGSMIGRFLVKMLRKAVARPLYRKFAAFEAACQRPEATQAELLSRILRYHADTAFGRDHGFGLIRNVADYRNQVEVAPYERLEPYIRRVMAGETTALLADPTVLMFALTSGTTAARKHIPITQQYLDDYRRGWNLWGLRAIKQHKQVFLKPILQLAGDADEYRTDAGIPCGNLSGFTAQVQKKLMRWMYVLPPATGKIKDSRARTYVALRSALPKKVGMLMSANPSTLVGLARAMDREKQALIKDVFDGTLNTDLDIPGEIRSILTAKLKARPDRARELEAAANAAGSLLPRHAWPDDRLLIGCWTGGSVGPYLRQLAAYYGAAPVRDLGLLASEGRMTIPVEDDTPSGVLDISTHFFEFIPEGEIDRTDPTVLGAHEVKEGGHYYIVPTTKAGLYRYHISDLVRVTGFFHQTPTIEFLGKGSRFANLTGEKLSEYHVTQSVDRVVKTVPQPLTAYSLAPCWDDVQPYYGLFLEEPDAGDPALLRRFVLALDLALGENNVEYEAKRTSGRLGPVRTHLVPAGFWAGWDRERVAKTGGSPEQYKHPCLIGDVNFRQTAPVIEGRAAA